jgi:hypothetical protein
MEQLADNDYGSEADFDALDKAQKLFVEGVASTLHLVKLMLDRN